MGRSKEQNEKIRDATRDKIMSAAVSLFVEKGLAATRTQDIAGRTGVSEGTLFNYYKTKEEIFDALIGVARQEIDALRQGLSLIPCPVEAINILAKDIIAEMTAGINYSQWQVLLMNAGDKTDGFLDGVIGALVALVKRGQSAGKFRDGDPAMIAQCFVATMQGLCLLQIASKSKFCVPTVDILTATILKTVHK